MDRTRRLTRLTLASVAGLIVLLPAGDLFARGDLAPWAVAVALPALAFVGFVQTRLLLGAPPTRWLAATAAVVGLALWTTLVDGDEEAHWVWALPFCGVVAGLLVSRAQARTRRRAALAIELGDAVGRLRAAGVAAEVQGTPQSVPVGLQPLFGSLVREGASNVLRHTRAERCELAIERDGRDVVVRVIDDGVAQVVVPDGAGTGIAALRERFAAAGGRVDAESLAPRGFQLSGRAPA